MALSQPVLAAALNVSPQMTRRPRGSRKALPCVSWRSRSSIPKCSCASFGSVGGGRTRSSLMRPPSNEPWSPAFFFGGQRLPTAISRQNKELSHHYLRFIFGTPRSQQDLPGTVIPCRLEGRLGRDASVSCGAFQAPPQTLFFSSVHLLPRRVRKRRTDRHDAVLRAARPRDTS